MRFLQKILEGKHVKIDKKDKKILKFLALNARTPITTIAKNVNLSNDAVKYRIEKLTKGGVIQGFTIVVDISKFGYENFHLFLKLNNPTKEAEQRLIDIFKSKPYIRAVIKFSGKFDFELAIVAKTNKEFDNILTELSSECERYLQDYEVLIITEGIAGHVFPKSFINIKTNPRIKKKKTDNYKLDNKDLKILDALAQNSQMRIYNIAKHAKISSDATIYRMKKMQNAGYIFAYTPTINYSVLDYTVYAVLLRIHNFNKKTEHTLFQLLRQNENILWAVKTVGSYNILFYLCAKKPDVMHETMISIRSKFSNQVITYETLIAYEEYKYLPFPRGLFKLK